MKRQKLSDKRDKRWPGSTRA